MSMETSYILAMDQGTTSSRAVLYDASAHKVAVGQAEFQQYYPRPGWVEHDPEEIWASQMAATAECIAKANVPKGSIKAVGIANQRETTVAWDSETSKPICNAIVWQCRRTSQLCERLTADGWTDEIRERTGLVIDAYFSATKMCWILENVPAAKELARQGRLRFGTVDTWLLWKLTDGKEYKTDHTNASRTMLFNINSMEWDEKLLKLFGIPRAALPEPCPSMSIFGTAILSGESVPICAIAGDQQAALFGQACFGKGDMKTTYGTGGFLLRTMGGSRVRTQNGLLSIIAWSDSQTTVYGLEGSIFNAGSSIKWLRDELGLIKTAAECDELAVQAGSNNGVYFVPAFTGLGAPYWDMYARGLLIGLTRGSGKKHIARAVLESIAYQTNDLIGCFTSADGMEISRMAVDGGAAVSDVLLEFQAGILGIPIERPAETESTALGVTFMAGLITKIWDNMEQIKAMRKLSRVFLPSMQPEIVEKNILGWRKAAQRALDFAEHDTF